MGIFMSFAVYNTLAWGSRVELPDPELRWDDDWRYPDGELFAVETYGNDSPYCYAFLRNNIVSLPNRQDPECVESYRVSIGDLDTQLPADSNTLIKQFREFCERRGLTILDPQPGWGVFIWIS